ncbi:PREDICTED: kinesin-related protein 4-like isoform X2 [Nicrophorus vespilloides]|uniref:Kinesin-related protein 4-like isoform X2 n=1 Tax=Nicrophorus vespilloides TaxID=110193 RepID=A0ABM1MX84_NICVS|nr:PREDICTED: kinesin-related protein 4-like isoform X2 [Nicrophorus vespilloides]
MDKAVVANKPSEHLDLEYLQILRLIKPYITCITNNRYIELVKMWLEKLSDESVTDKAVRNYYLVQLGHQIEDGVLAGPFLAAPPIGDLGPFVDPPTTSSTKLRSKTRIFRAKKKRSRKAMEKALPDDGNDEDNDDEEEENDEKEDSWLDITDDGMASGDASSNFRSNLGYDEQDDYDSKMKNLLHVIEELRMENTALNQIAVKCGSNPDIGGLVGEVEELKSKLHEILDMKNALHASHRTVTGEWQSTLASLHKKLETAHAKNLELRGVISDLRRRLAEEQPLEMHENQMNLLKEKHLQDLQDLENTYKREINEKCTGFNEKYQELLTWYELKVEQIRAETESRMHAYYEKEISQLRVDFDAEMKRFCAEKREDRERELKEMYKQQLQNDSANAGKIREFCASRMEEMRAEHDKEIAFRDEEIVRLENLLQEQCGRMQEEVQIIRNQMDVANIDESSNEKIRFLQRCVLKMDKLYKKAEKEFGRQVVRMRREFDLKEKHNQVEARRARDAFQYSHFEYSQIQLTTQRVSLISNSGILKQKEIDQIVIKLEEHYREMLVEQQHEAVKDKRNDQKIIAELREQLQNK